MYVVELDFDDCGLHQHCYVCFDFFFWSKLFVLTWNKRKLLSFGILVLYALMQFSVSCFKTSNE